MLPNRTQQVMAVSLSAIPDLLSLTSRCIALFDWLKASWKCRFETLLSLYDGVHSKNRLYIAPRAITQCWMEAC